MRYTDRHHHKMAEANSTAELRLVVDSFKYRTIEEASKAMRTPKPLLERLRKKFGYDEMTVDG